MPGITGTLRGLALVLMAALLLRGGLAGTWSWRPAGSAFSGDTTSPPSSWSAGTFIGTATGGDRTIRASAANHEWRSVAYGEGLFVAIGPSGSYRMMTSTTGTT